MKISKCKLKTHMHIGRTWMIHQMKEHCIDIDIIIIELITKIKLAHRNKKNNKIKVTKLSRKRIKENIVIEIYLQLKHKMYINL